MENIANKGIDGNGLSHLWVRLLNFFVPQEKGKGLSSNDYTFDEKSKLGGIESGANKTTVTDNLSSTSTTDALSANQGRELDKKIKAINTDIGNLGGGDMLKSVYDTDGNGKVDGADNADKLGGEPPSAYVKQNEIKDVAKTGSYNDLKDKPTDFAPSSHTHEQREIIGLEDALDEITAIAEGKRKSYTFETVAELDAALAEYMAFITDGTPMSESNRLNGQTLGNGDVFLIVDKKVPDYWWDTASKSKQELETTKVEIEFLSNEEIDAIIANV